jgi:hypothetical protein
LLHFEIDQTNSKFGSGFHGKTLFQGAVRLGERRPTFVANNRIGTGAKVLKLRIRPHRGSGDPVILIRWFA